MVLIAKKFLIPCFLLFIPCKFNTAIITSKKAASLRKLLLLLYLNILLCLCSWPAKIDRGHPFTRHRFFNRTMYSFILAYIIL